MILIIWWKLPLFFSWQTERIFMHHHRLGACWLGSSFAEKTQWAWTRGWSWTSPAAWKPMYSGLYYLKYCHQVEAEDTSPLLSTGEAHLESCARAGLPSTRETRTYWNKPSEGSQSWRKKGACVMWGEAKGKRVREIPSVYADIWWGLGVKKRTQTRNHRIKESLKLEKTSEIEFHLLLSPTSSWSSTLLSGA